jgi:predicted permease
MNRLIRRLQNLLPGRRRAEEQEMRAEFEALQAFADPRELGNLTLAAENARAVWGFAWLESFFADLRYALRTLARQPSFTAVAVLSLGLGIGANAAIYSLLDRVLWRQLPVADPDRLVTTKNSYSTQVYTRFRDLSGDYLEGAALTAPIDRDIDNHPGRVEMVTGNYFQLLGVQAHLGRALTPADQRNAVVSYRYWQSALGAEPVLGRPIHINKIAFTIVGVAPPEFFGVAIGDAPDLWIPVSNQPAIMPNRNWIDDPHMFYASLIARLRPGVTRERASAALTPVSVRIDLERQRPDLPAAVRRRIENQKLELLPLAAGLSSLRERFSKPLHVLFAMVAMGLLLACVNVMGLQFARSSERRREFGVRLAIGAGRGRLIRQLLTESLTLALIGGALGLALCRPAASAVAGLISVSGQPVRLDLSIDTRMLAFVFAISVASAVVCGMIPAFRATRGDVQLGPRGATAARSQRASGRLAAALQLGISVILIAGALLFAVSLHRLTTFDTGLDRRGLAVMEVDFTEAGYKGPQIATASARLLDRFRGLPGVTAASYTGLGIYTNRGWNPAAATDTVPAAAAWFDLVGPDYFHTMGTRLLAGRDIDARDRKGAETVAVVSESFARYFFPDGHAVGRNVYLGRNKEEVFHVIGVAADVRTNVRTAPRRMCYLARAQRDDEFFPTRFLIRGAVTASDLRSAVHAEDSGLRVVAVDTADQLLNRTLDLDRVIAALAFAFGVLALTLAAVGIYGMLSFDVTRRTGEIGVRMALGATRSGVVAMVLREAALVGAVGIAAGLVAAVALGKMVAGLVYDLKPGDPRVLAAAAALLALVALAAALAPARRAAAMDPMRALRTE